LSGYDQRADYSLNPEDWEHISSVWLALLTLDVVFIFFTGTLLAYHTFLVLSGQTTWEHSRKHNISYLKVYPVGVMPFYEGLWGNLK
jgi:palmitoyltransferase